MLFRWIALLLRRVARLGSRRIGSRRRIAPLLMRRRIASLLRRIAWTKREHYARFTGHLATAYLHLADD